MKHLVRAQQFSIAGLKKLFDMADEMRVMHGHPLGKRTMRARLQGMQMFSVFYEPSTRTRFTFESGAHLLGMNVVSSDNAGKFSSAVKGEPLEDSARVYAGLVPDFIVIRHMEDGAAERFATVIDKHGYECHVINAGDGRHQHPSQALLDAYTIERRYGRISGLTVVIGGDLANGRTVRSLAYLLGKYDDVRIIFVSPPELRVANDILEYLDRHGVTYSQTDDMLEALPVADVVYWTRLQTERIDDEDFSQRMQELQQTSFTIRGEHLELMKGSAIIMHPFPRKGEIAVEVDADPRAYYFKQAENGLWARMALLFLLSQDVEL